MQVAESSLQTATTPSYTEDALKKAIFDATDAHPKLSISQSAEKWGIPKNTLSLRIKGTTASRDEVIQPKQRLSTAEEDHLVKWILRQESLGHAPTASVVRQVVCSILKKKGDFEPLGKHWLDGFKKRNSTIRAKIGRVTEASRFDGFTPKSVN
jgi:hypothetical protein